MYISYRKYQQTFYEQNIDILCPKQEQLDCLNSTKKMQEFWDTLTKLHDAKLNSLIPAGFRLNYSSESMGKRLSFGWTEPNI